MPYTQAQQNGVPSLRGAKISNNPHGLKSESTGWLPRKKAVLFSLLILATGGILVLSAYTDLGRVSVATTTGREWVGKMFDSAMSDGAPYAEPPPCFSRNGSGCALPTTALPVNKTLPTSSRLRTAPRNNLSPNTAIKSPFKCDSSSPYIFCGGIPQIRTLAEREADLASNDVWKIADIRHADWQAPMTFMNCRYNNCVSVGKQVTKDADVVHVYGVGLSRGFPLPARHPNQLWLYSVWESPHHTHADFLNNAGSPWNNVFDLTMSYKVDSDVFAPYGFIAFEPIPKEKQPNYYEIAKQKTRSVAWFVSNCRTPSKRMDYVKELKKHIDVDIYGGCGIPCSKTNGKCTKDLPTTYKFYLSFENSICTDYISEKFFKIYKEGMHVIPVARGASLYNRYFPKHTFINVADFASPQKLAEYLKSLGSDLGRYARMLEIKDQYRAFGGLDSMWCNLCEALNTKTVGTKKYNMKKWFGDGHCKTPRDFG